MTAATTQLHIAAQFLPNPGERAGFVLLIALAGSFLFIRTSARMIRAEVSWWPGNVETSSGLHLHHLVWGIVLMMLSGFLNFVIDPGSPQTEVFAFLFGVGAGLTLDEFALWIHLRDVYWLEEGRSSFRAVLLAVVLGGLIILTIASYAHGGADTALSSVAITVGVTLICSGGAIIKGKPMMGLIGIVFFPISLTGFIRLATPTSIWARRFYDPDGPKMVKSEARFAKIKARHLRWMDRISGAPGLPQPKVAEVDSDGSVHAGSAGDD